MNFATNEDEAEAQPAESYEQQNNEGINQTSTKHKEFKSPPDQSNIETGGQDSGKKDEEHRKRQGIDREESFASYSDDNAKVWKTYMDQAKISDSQLVTVLNSDLDSLLIFAGLFSAILSAFLIEIRKGLQEDLQATTNGLLRVLIQNQHNSTLVDFNPPPYKPSLGLLWINGLWFSSLIFSLISALGASLAKGWVMQYATTSYSNINAQEACLRHDRFIGITCWHLQMIVQSLPIPIHAAFFLFSAGLVILLREEDAGIYNAILTLVIIIAFLYVGSTILPLFASNCPFRTPVTTLISRLVSKVIPESQGSPLSLFTKAKALAWLVTNSADEVVIEEAMQAIAGLPANPRVQDALYESSVADVLVRGLSGCTADGGKSPKLRTYLYSILQLVQTGPSISPNARSVDVLVSLVRPGGLELTNDMERGAREVAFCIRARVQLLLCNAVPDSVLLDTDVLSLLQSSAEPHTRCLLAEIYLLNRNVTSTGSIVTTGGPNPLVSLLDKLRSKNTDTRIEGHEELRNAANIEAFRLVVSNFGVRKVLMMLTHGSSHMRAQYGKVMREHLVCYSDFRRKVVDNSAAGFLLDLVRCESDLPGHDLLEGFTNDGYAKSKLVTPEALGHLTKGMGVESQSVRIGIMHAIIRLVKSDDIRVMVVTPGVMLVILDGVRDMNPEVQQAALEVLAAFLEYDDIRARIPTPELMSIIAKTGDQSPVVREAALKVVATFMQHSNIQARVSTPELSSIMAKIMDPYEDVQHAALTVVAIFMEHDDLRARVSTPELMSIMAKTEDQSLLVREAALKVVAIFMQHGDIRARVPTPELMSIMAKTEDQSPVVREAALEVLAAYLEYDDIRARVSTPELMSIMAKIKYKYGSVQHAALKIVATFMGHGDIRARVSIPELMSIMAKTEDQSFSVQSAAMRVVAIFMQYGDIRARVSTPELILAIIAKIEDPYKPVQCAALGVLAAFLEYSDIRARVSTSKLISITKDSSDEAQQAALEVLAAYLEYDDIRARVSTSELMSIMAQAENYSWAALKVVAIFLQHGDVRARVPTPELILAIMAKIKSRWVHKAVRDIALEVLAAFLEYDDIQARVPTPPLIFAILATCGNGNPDVRRAGLEVVTIFTKSESDDSRLRISTTAVISETLLKLEHELSAVREAAQKILLYIGLAAIIPTTFDRLAQLLVHPDTAIRVSILPLLLALVKEDLSAYNTQLLWNPLLKMLQRSATRAFALQGLSAFAKHDNFRHDILAHSDIQKILLEMIRSDDVDVWVVAAEGLLVFGLFQ